ncbi:MAG: succinate dehydrogenase assembly factor 2 [Rhodospirillales bacterium]|nr:succinate dehydrogenase assembly factor 2 [Rhodospirillales bacterium]
MDARRKKLLFQSQHCGIKENDILLGQFAASHLASMSDGELDQFEALLGENDHDIYAWVVGHQAPAPHVNNSVMAALINFKDTR